MTWLDLLCGLLLLLLMAGGYAQGFIRGVLRLVALFGGGLLGTLLMLRLGTLGTAPTTAVWAAVVALIGVTVSSLIFWSLTRIVPPFVHARFLNRLLGTLPALLIGLVILALILSLADRVALREETQLLIREGLLTGPLVQTVDALEQTVAGVR